MGDLQTLEKYAARAMMFVQRGAYSIAIQEMKDGLLLANLGAVRVPDRERSARPARPPIPETVRAMVLLRDGYQCAYCGKHGERADLTLDHVTPWSRGGSDDASNLVAACRRCNSKKGARTPEEWLA